MGKIKVLHTKARLSSDGATTILLNMAKELKDEVQFDFLLYGEEESDWSWKFEELGSKIFYVKVKNKNKIFKELERIHFYNCFFKENNYDIIHINTDNVGKADILFCAFRGGINKRIYHSHNSRNENKVFMSGIPGYKKILKRFVAIHSTNLLACSKEAAEWMFPEIFLQDVTIIKNGIDTKKFRFNLDSRNRIRKQYDLENCFVIGCVARFVKQKNYSFLIDIFTEVVKEEPNARLLLIGEGELKEDIQKKVENLSFTDKVIFVGSTDKVQDYMNAMDIYVMPSLFEGLGLAFIEAQSTGLYCIASTNVSKEAKICSRMAYISLNEGLDKWRDEILKETGRATPLSRSEAWKDVLDAGYDIKEASRQLLKIYQL